MGKRTKKVGITGKYGTRYGASIRKVLRKIEVSQHSKFISPFGGKLSMKREVVGIWKCTHTKKKYAGGAYQLQTPAAITVRTAINRLRKAQNASKQ